MLPVWSLQLTIHSVNTGQISALKGNSFQRRYLIKTAATSLHAYGTVCRIDMYVLMNKFTTVSNINMNKQYATETYSSGMLQNLSGESAHKNRHWRWITILLLSPFSNVSVIHECRSQMSQYTRYFSRRGMKYYC